MSSKFFDWQEEIDSGTGEFRGSFALTFGNALQGFVPSRNAHIYGTDYKLLCQPSAMLTPGFLGIIAEVLRLNYPSFGGQGNITMNYGQNATANYFGPVINIRRGPIINRQTDGMLGLIGQKLEHALAPDTHGTPEEQAHAREQQAQQDHDTADKAADQSKKADEAAKSAKEEEEQAALRASNAQQAARTAEARAKAAEETAKEDPSPRSQKQAQEAREKARQAQEHAEQEANDLQKAKDKVKETDEKAKAAKTHAEVSKKNADESDHKAKEARTHADNVKQAAEAKQQADDAKKKASEAQQHAEAASKAAQQAKKAVDKARQAHVDAANEKPFSQAKINQASKDVSEAEVKSQAAQDKADAARHQANEAQQHADNAQKEAADAAQKAKPPGSGGGHGTTIDPAPNLTSGAQAKIDTAVGIVTLGLSYLLCGVAAITDIALKTQYTLDATNFPDEKFLKQDGNEKAAQLLYDLSSKTFVPVLSQVIIQLEQSVFLVDQCIGYAKDMLELFHAATAATESLRTAKNRLKIAAEMIVKTLEMVAQVLQIVDLVKELIAGFDDLHEAHLMSYLHTGSSNNSNASTSGKAAATA